MEGSGIKGYHVLLTCCKKTLVDYADETEEKEFSSLKLLNLTSYNELIVVQEDKVCFQIVEKAKTKSSKYRDAKQAWMKLSRNFDPTT